MGWFDAVKDVGKKIWEGANDLAGSDLGKALTGGASTATQVAAGYYGGQQSLEGIREQNATAKEIAANANAMEVANAEAYNKSQQAIAAGNTAASAKQAKDQMAFQGWMSNTAHRREAADLQLAGLNRILSGTGGLGASTPAGAQGQVFAPDQTKPKVHTYSVKNEGTAVATAFQIFNQLAAANKANAEATYIREARTAQTQAETKKTESVTMSQEFEKLSRVIKNSQIAQVEIKDAADAALKAQMKNANIAGEKNTEKHTELLDMKVQQAVAELARMLKDKEIYEGEAGYWIRLLEKLGPLAGKIPNVIVPTKSIRR